MNFSYYKYCIVPQCNSTTIKTPNKLFIYIPNNGEIRKKWLKLARREDAHSLSTGSRMYFCEDHFDLPNDMINYMEYHIKGTVSQVRMKPGCMPSKFGCQEDRRKRTCSSTERPYILKKQRKVIIAECLNESKESCTSSFSLIDTSDKSSKMSAIFVKSERQILTSAIATLIYLDESYLENGIPIDDLVRVVAASQEFKCTKQQLENIIKKELLSGSLVKLPNGTLALGPPDNDGDSRGSFQEHNDSNTKMTSSANSSSRSSPQCTRGRPENSDGTSSTSMHSSTTQNAGVKVEMSAIFVKSERQILTSAIATLIYQDESYLENGIPIDDLVRVVAASQEFKCTKQQLENIIKKELLSGSLVKLPNGTLALGPPDNDGDSCGSFQEHNDSNTKMTSSANSSSRSSPQCARGRPENRGGTSSTSMHSSTTQNAGVRVGERHKMAKKVFDPSDNNVPSKRKRGRPIGSLNKSTIKKRLMIAGKDKVDTPLSESQQSLDGSADEMENDETVPHETSGDVCSVCLVQKPRGSNDRLVECCDCNNKAHLSCLQTGASILKPRPDNTWQCQHCKTCVVCCETNDAGILTVCSICLDAYHAVCHSPRIPEKAWDQWECNNCLESRPTVVGSPAIHLNNIDIDPFFKPHELDRVQTKLSEEAPIDPNIPDISNWNVDNVYNYFLEHFPETAPILLKQEFDGQALSMATRADIVRGLGLPLGPALALYRIVVKLQTKKDNWRMCWG